jgi:hypothetical protein
MNGIRQPPLVPGFYVYQDKERKGKESTWVKGCQTFDYKCSKLGHVQAGCGQPGDQGKEASKIGPQMKAELMDSRRVFPKH